MEIRNKYVWFQTSLICYVPKRRAMFYCLPLLLGFVTPKISALDDLERSMTRSSSVQHAASSEKNQKEIDSFLVDLKGLVDRQGLQDEHQIEALANLKAGNRVKSNFEQPFKHVSIVANIYFSPKARKSPPFFSEEHSVLELVLRNDIFPCLFHQTVANALSTKLFQIPYPPPYGQKPISPNEKNPFGNWVVHADLQKSPLIRLRLSIDHEGCVGRMAFMQEITNTVRN
jgi:hypothetical protein